LLVLACIGAFLIRANGLKWPEFHPDEGVIGIWLERSPAHLCVCDRVYPNGFLTLARPFVFVYRAAAYLGERWNYFCGAIDRVDRNTPDGILFGRWFNVFAGAFVCLFVFLMASRMAKSQWAGLAAACLVGFAQYAVEHSHYAETDIAALLALSVFFLFLVMAVDLAALRWLLAAALAAGFAAGTKFTLIALAPIVLLEAVLFAMRHLTGPGTLAPPSADNVVLERRAELNGHIMKSGSKWAARSARDSCRRPDSWLHALIYIGLVILLFAVGFVCANPDLLLRFRWFYEGLGHEKYRVYGETASLLGAAGAQKSVKYLLHCRLLNTHALTLGLGWLALIAASLPCLAFGAMRRYFSVLIVFPVLFAFYWIFMAPWVRSQEFLLFLPSAAALAVIPLAALWRTKHFFFRVACLALAVLALTMNACNGLRVAELFGWKDTRLIAREWLEERLPMESRLAAEFYARNACVNMPAARVVIRKVEAEGMAPLREQGVDYFLRAAGVRGRGLRHPLTDELYPGARSNLTCFTRDSTLLAAWAPLPPAGLATFISPDIELYGLKHFEPALSLQAEAPQPALIVNADEKPVGRQTFCKTGRRLGCADALLVDRVPRTIAIGGPGALESPAYLVLTTAERPAQINVRGFGLFRNVALEPYDAAVVPLRRSGRRLFKKPFETVTLSAEPVRDVLYIPCYARVVFSVSEAVRIFLDAGRADRILKYFSGEVLAKELGVDLKSLLAAGRRADQAGNLVPDAKQIAELKTVLEQCLRTNVEAVVFNGVNGYYFNRFARARLQSVYDFSCGPERGEYEKTPLQNAVRILDLQPSDDGAGEKYSAQLLLPVLIARGRYELHGEIMMAESVVTNTGVPVDAYFATGGSAGRIVLHAGRWIPFSLALEPHREAQPCLRLVAPASCQIRLRNMELTWNLADVLKSLRNELERAEAGQLQGGPAAPRAVPSAVADPISGDREKSRSSTKTLQNQPQFGPWLKLVGFDFDAQKREAGCVFEVLQDDIPPLEVAFWIERHGEWRRRQTMSLAPGKRLVAGEKIILTAPLNATLFKHGMDMRRLGLGIETDVLWHAGAISTVDQGMVVPFANLH